MCKGGADSRSAGWGHAGPRRAPRKRGAGARRGAHGLPFVQTAAYVGRYGWITATVTDAETLEAALEWLRESYWLNAPAAIRDAAFAD